MESKNEALQKGHYKHYMLGLLAFILAFNYVDRQILSIVLQEIKTDLSLSDTQLGLLTGIAFAFFYALMGIPIARWADRGNRVAIITITTTLWSVMVILCGLASNFLYLLLARVGVAVGEAGCMPPANSLIPEYFNRKERPRAVAIYMMGSSLSVVIGYLGGGLLADMLGWRWTFILLGLPGIALGVLAWFTLREPRKLSSDLKAPGSNGLHQRQELEQDAAISHIPIKEVVFTLLRNTSFCHLVAAFTVLYFFGYGIMLWLPSFFIRIHDMTTSEIGIWMALGIGGSGALGTYIGGALASRYAAGKEALQFRVMAIVFCAYSIVSVSTYLVPNKYTALLLMTLGMLLAMSANGPVFACIQSLVNQGMRATAIALVYLVANLIGLGLGPLAIGIVSDMLTANYGDESLRYSLILFSPGYIWGGIHLWLASRKVEEFIAKTDSTIRMDKNPSYRGAEL